MKKFLAIVLSMALLLSLSAFGALAAEENAPSNQEESSDSAELLPGEIIEFAPWTENIVAMNVPEPPAQYKIFEKQSTETFCMIEITYATLDEIRAYGEYLQACGFNIEAEISESETADGRTLYNFKAKNAAGCSLKLNFTQMSGDYTMAYFEIYLQ